MKITSALYGCDLKFVYVSRYSIQKIAASSISLPQRIYTHMETKRPKDNVLNVGLDRSTQQTIILAIMFFVDSMSDKKVSSYCDISPLQFLFIYPTVARKLGT